MRRHRSRSSLPEPNIIPLCELAKLFYPLCSEARRLVDHIPRDELWRLIPRLRELAGPLPDEPSLFESVGEKNFRAVPVQQLSAASNLNEVSRRCRSDSTAKAPCSQRQLVRRCIRWLQGRSRRTKFDEITVTEDVVSPRRTSTLARTPLRTCWSGSPSDDI